MGTPFHLFTSNHQLCVLLQSSDKGNYNQSFLTLFILPQKDLFLRSFSRQTQVEEVILVSKAANRR